MLTTKGFAGIGVGVAVLGLLLWKLTGITIGFIAGCVVTYYFITWLGNLHSTKANS